MVKHEENRLPWQIKDWFNSIKKFPKRAQSLELVKFQVHSPLRVKGNIRTETMYILTDKRSKYGRSEVIVI